jgi:hypothetical protein
MKNHLTLLVFYLFSTIIYSQSISQTIRGVIIDKETKLPIVGAIVLVENLETISNIEGNFKIEKVPIGRRTLLIFKENYKSQTINDLQLNVAKEIVLNIELVENIIVLSEVILKKDTKISVINNNISVSARTFSPKETNRYAGSQADPSRMARNFAGVSGANDQRNDIVIRGNSPLGLLWRLEGVAIPNPNHFGSQGSTGGPVSILNPQILANSDFLTSAFPSEYGNASSGVFDLRLRNGNNEKVEKTVTFGPLGIEALVEGPFSKTSQSSFLISYRYSTLSILTSLGVKLGFPSIPKYQDLTFKINHVTKKTGTFSFYGIGGISSTTFFDSKRDSTQFSPANKGENVAFGSKTAVLGLRHTYFFKNDMYIKTNITTTYEGNNGVRDSILANKSTFTIGGRGYSNFRNILASFVNKKFDAKNALQLGFSVEQINYKSKDSLFKRIDANNKPVFLFKNDFDGRTALLQSYLQWKHKFTDDLTMNSGLHFQYFDLNKQSVIEPRLGLNWNFKPNQTFSFGYGMHSQTQDYGFLFYKSPVNNKENNRNLKFTQSHQVVFGYDIIFSKSFRFKAETYFQYLTNVPVESISSSYSLLNFAGNFGETLYRDNLVNNGTGKNYGLELTLEKFFETNYYLLFTASFFDSKYKGSDKIERNTSYNGKYVVNFLGGYELKMKNNYTFLVNGKITVAGGLPYTPIDKNASIANNGVIYKENEAYSVFNQTYIKPDIRIGFRKNFEQKLAIEGLFDFQNVINRKNVYFQVYDKNTNDINTVYQNGLFPTFLIKVEF